MTAAFVEAGSMSTSKPVPLDAGAMSIHRIDMTTRENAAHKPRRYKHAKFQDENIVPLR